MTADLDTLSPADRLKIRASDYDRVVAALDFLSLGSSLSIRSLLRVGSAVSYGGLIRGEQIL